MKVPPEGEVQPEPGEHWRPEWEWEESGGIATCSIEHEVLGEWHVEALCVVDDRAAKINLSVGSIGIDRQLDYKSFGLGFAEAKVWCERVVEFGTDEFVKLAQKEIRETMMHPNIPLKRS